jgi:hypothetical protein
MDACGVQDVEGREIIGSILGTRTSALRGPWSLAVRADGERWRLGSSEWARCPEFQHKRRRLASVIAERGGDGRFTEAAYKLLEAEQGDGAPGRIGRAVEVEFVCGPRSGSAVTIECFLAVPAGRMA